MENEENEERTLFPTHVARSFLRLSRYHSHPTPLLIIPAETAV